MTIFTEASSIIVPNLTLIKLQNGSRSGGTFISKLWLIYTIEYCVGLLGLP